MDVWALQFRNILWEVGVPFLKHKF